MDNAMLKRGIGAVVLAIIAALLLGWLLKDKSQDRQDIVEMEIPGVSDMKIPSLTDVSDKVTESAATLVGETKDAVSNTGSAIIDSASSTMDSASEKVEEVTNSVVASVDSATTKVEDTVASATTDNANPGFSFRPPTKNEEQQINTASTTENTTTAEAKTTTATNNQVVASAPKAKAAEKTFKPTIENEPKKVVKKVTKKAEKKAPAVAKKPKAKPAAKSSGSGKYTIQLLATSSQSRAKKLANTMSGEGYNSFITQTTSNNKVLFRVRVGGHKDRNSAINAQNTMKRRYQKNFFVQNSLVVSQ